MTVFQGNIKCNAAFSLLFASPVVYISFFVCSLKYGRLTLIFLSAMADVLGDGGSSGLVISEGPIVSEHRLDQETALNLKEDHEIEVDVLKASVDLPEEKPPISDDSPDTQEIHVKKIIFHFFVSQFWFS